MKSTSKVEGRKKATIGSENRPFSFTVANKVDVENLSRTFYSNIGNLEFYDGNICDNEYEYSFYLDCFPMKLKGKLDGGRIFIKSSGDSGVFEFSMTRED